MKHYYERRADEYDATTYELAREDPSAAPDLAELERLLAGLEPGRVLDIGCGTGWLTQFLRGSVVALDQSEAMLGIAAKARPRCSLRTGRRPAASVPGGLVRSRPGRPRLQPHRAGGRSTRVCRQRL